MAELLGDQGPIAEHLPGFAPREEQQHLATAVHEALENQALLVGEAGTGIGKTFAYLVPAMISGQRVIISTGTRHLQDQLFYTDLPLVKRALGLGITTSLLKGRSNYLCRHRLAKAMRHPVLSDQKHQTHLRLLQDWSRRTTTGDVAEVLDVPEDSMVWGFVTSNNEFCSQHEFEDLADCFIHKARKQAQESDIVVVNHHLLCADLALKEEGFGDLLPSANGFIIDEAHQLPEIAAQFFGRKLSSRQLLDLARDVVGDQLHEAPDMSELRDHAGELESSVRYFRLAFGVEPNRDAWNAVATQSGIERELDRLEEVLETLYDVLDSVQGRGKGLESCYRRVQAHRSTFNAFTAQDPDSEYIHWFETFRTGFSLNMTPMNVAKPFQRAMQQMASSWVFTSATLAVGGDFSHFKARLGLTETDELQVDSPFNYRQNAMLFLPEGLPEPSHAGFTKAAMDAIIPVLKASQGRAFLLFTSYRAMNEASAYLADKFDYPMLCQGQMPKRELVEAFQSLGNAVLLGTSSFWEGVDVRGEALSCVVIDKLPFGSPGDPVMSARIDQMKQSGGNPFYEYQLPQAAISLKQGVGRLIRDVTDTGVLVLCDPRIRTRNYGEVFINSMPAMPITRELEEVEEFYRRIRQSYATETES
ncbi:MAG: ATP-dependent DNA helicase [Gammaproteobacteria bacterium]|nr:ATP-dependent DNA helicase [Gammaproteobacteria bacterium]